MLTYNNFTPSYGKTGRSGVYGGRVSRRQGVVESFCHLVMPAQWV